MSKRICIVTPDIIGPIKNGGIGTACYWLALFLARNGYSITLLYTGPFQNSTFSEVQAKYLAEGVEFHSLSEIKAVIPTHVGLDHAGIVSDRIYQFLKRLNFDVIHFQDWHGNGFASIQAKKIGLAFQNTQLVLALHSPSQWEREGMKVWPADPVVEGRLDYMEKYAIENADSVWAPSRAMLQWVHDHGIKPKTEARVVRYLINLDIEEKTLSYAAKDPSHLIFFGRLETRKGIELFAAAINQLVKSGKDHGIKRITFMGKLGLVQNSQSVAPFLKERIEHWQQHGIVTKIVDTYDAFQAIRFIHKTGGIAVIPSLLDNYPYTVLECIQGQIPCLAAATGGIPEMLSPDVIFEPDVDSLVEVLLGRVERINKMAGKYSPGQTREDWLSYTAALCSHVAQPNPASEPRVSICVAYYNYGQYLPQLLHSLTLNDYPNFEVIVVNDGSTEPSSIDAFERLKLEFSPKGWRFLSHPRQGIGATRNFAASQAKGGYLIFMDSDNIAVPQMIRTFVTGITKSGADALTCIAAAFQGDDYPTDTTPFVYIYRPIGPALELGMMENVFGDVNAIVRKTAFDDMGGFGTDRFTSSEDWELFASLALNGFHIDVVPEVLFCYRVHGKGFSQTTNQKQNQLRVLKAYLSQPDKMDIESLLTKFVAPLFHLRTVLSKDIGSPNNTLAKVAGLPFENDPWDLSKIKVLLTTQRAGSHFLKSIVENTSRALECTGELLRDKGPLIQKYPAISSSKQLPYFWPWYEQQVQAGRISALPDSRVSAFLTYLNYLSARVQPKELLVDIKYNSVRSLSGYWDSELGSKDFLDILVAQRVPVLHLTRKNLVRMVISNRLATETGIWHRTKERSVDEPLPRLRVDPSDLLDEIRYHHRVDADYRTALLKRGFTEEVVYEDLVEEFEQGVPGRNLDTLRRFFKFPADFYKQVSCTFKKTTPEDLGQVVDNWDDLKTAILDTDFGWMVKN